MSVHNFGGRGRSGGRAEASEGHVVDFLDVSRLSLLPPSSAFKLVAGAAVGEVDVQDYVTWSKEWNSFHPFSGELGIAKQNQFCTKKN